MQLNYAVILGTMRRERMGIRAARWMMQAIAARGHGATLVDPLEPQLPLLDRMYKEYPEGRSACRPRAAGRALSRAPTGSSSSARNTITASRRR